MTVPTSNAGVVDARPPAPSRTTPAGGARASPSVVAATVAGNTLEFFDFTPYAFFAVYIGETFFPAHDALISVMLSVAVFGVGFITRPLGGLFIGAFADRAGRKPVMLLTIGLITVGTLGLAVTPSYEHIGLAAPVIVILCRLIQGFTLGGEVGPSSSYLIEIAPPGRRGLYGSWQLASQGGAWYNIRHDLDGMFELAHIDRKQLEGFSQRGAQIEARLSAAGLDRSSATPGQKQQATMQSRACGRFRSSARCCIPGGAAGRRS